PRRCRRTITPLPAGPTSLQSDESYYLPAASAFTSSVVSGFPPIHHSPLFTSSTTTQVTCRIFSPSTLTMASVSFFTISCFCESEKTPSMSLTLINGINLSPLYFHYDFLPPALPLHIP